MEIHALKVAWNMLTESRFVIQVQEYDYCSRKQLIIWFYSIIASFFGLLFLIATKGHIKWSIVFLAVTLIGVFISEWCYILVNTWLFNLIGKAEMVLEEGKRLFFAVFATKLIVILFLNFIFNIFNLILTSFIDLSIFHITTFGMMIYAGIPNILIAIWECTVFYNIFKYRCNQSSTQSIIKLIFVAIINITLQFICLSIVPKMILNILLNISAN